MKTPLLAIALLLLFNTAIAALLTVIEFGAGFRINLIFSQCIGCCIALVNSPLILRLAPGWKRWLALAVALPVSVMLGIVLAHPLADMPFEWSKQLWQSLAIGMMFAVIGSAVFLLAEHIHRLDDEVRRRRIAAEEQARRETEARLKLLQAQIEPHFLFNTLANVGGLIDSDPPRARRLLDHLNDWLRLALARTRGNQSSLDDELKLLENWLQILSVRFGARLRWTISADAEVRRCALPPMLLQPLLENAVKHGIEPKVGGGCVQIIADIDRNSMRITVNDDGMGLSADASLTGTGLDNVRARLQLLYGEAGRLRLGNNPTGGVTAVLELPCAR